MIKKHLKSVKDEIYYGTHLKAYEYIPIKNPILLEIPISVINEIARIRLNILKSF